MTFDGLPSRLLALLFLGLSSASLLVADGITVDGKRLRGDALFDGKVLKFGSKPVPLNGTASIILNAPSLYQPGDTYNICLADGSVLAGRISGYNKKIKSIKVQLKTGHDISMPVSKILFAVNRRYSLPKPGGAIRSMVVRLPSGNQVVGTLDYITPLYFGLRAGKERERLRFSGIARIDFKTGVPAPSTSDALYTNFGDVLHGKLQRIDPKHVTFSFNNSALSIDRSVVSRIDLARTRKALNALAPVKTTHTPFLDSIHSSKRNSTLFGHLITLGPSLHHHGIAMQSRTEQTYALNGNYSALQFSTGLDTSLTSSGDAELIVKGDNRVLIKQRVAANVRHTHFVPLAGVKNLSILVDYGKFGSGGDYVLIASPQLIKK